MPFSLADNSIGKSDVPGGQQIGRNNRHSDILACVSKGKGDIIIPCSAGGCSTARSRKRNGDAHRNCFPLIFKRSRLIRRITVFNNFSRTRREMKLRGTRHSSLYLANSSRRCFM